ncbi:MAG: non-heme iron oxygenase ferredoxin subunit [Alphaproteobacteria bacterium]
MSEQWHDVCGVDEVDEEDLIGVRVDGVCVAIYNINGEFFATSNICTHEHALLSEGFVIDDVIECPLHQGRFQIRTGKPGGAPVSTALKTFPLKRQGDRLLVCLG